jgi:hypothetical protein
MPPRLARSRSPTRDDAQPGRERERALLGLLVARAGCWVLTGDVALMALPKRHQTCCATSATRFDPGADAVGGHSILAPFAKGVPGLRRFRRSVERSRREVPEIGAFPVCDEV